MCCPAQSLSFEGGHFPAFMAQPTNPRPVPCDDSHERAARAAGHGVVCGIDEAGRGPLAGPVVAAAVVLPDVGWPPGLNDSKKLSAARREVLFEELTSHPAVFWVVEFAWPDEIAALNILGATHAAMRRCAAHLVPQPEFALIDGLPVPDFPVPSEALVKGDGRSVSIAAASILAKVARDRYMREAAVIHPGYGFEKHKGYGTRAHLEALERLGPCAIHRRGFAPIDRFFL